MSEERPWMDILSRSDVEERAFEMGRAKGRAEAWKEALKMLLDRQPQQQGVSND